MKLTRILASGLLAFLGLGAVAAAIPMIVTSLRHSQTFMPLSLLQHSPFDSFLIPGIILLIANGLLAFFVLWRVAARKPLYGLWTVFQGCVLLGWLVVECLMLQVIAWPHVVYAVLAVGLIVLGFLMRRESMLQPRTQG